MQNKTRYHRKIILHKGHLTYGLVSIIAVCICYFYVDRNASFFFNSFRHTDFYNVFFCMQLLSSILEYAVPLVCIYSIVMLFLKRFYYFEVFLFAAVSCLLISRSVVHFLKYLFGRYWTKTFINNNLSLQNNAVYGFNFFHDGKTFESFPSGHSAVIFAVMTVVWIMYPRFRWLSVLCCIVVITGLLGCNFHFPSDIIAGAFIGVIAAYFVLHASQIFPIKLEEHEIKIYKWLKN
jgi:membrane-associated phospholipid phosphatase